MSAASPFPTPSPVQPGPRSRTVEIDDPLGGVYTHYDNCPEGSPDPVLWVCDEDHWLAWDVPAGVGDQCPIVFHDANSDGRCVGRLSRSQCVCRDGAR